MDDLNALQSRIQEFTSAQIDDMSRGLNDWKNIQAVVRNTFVNLCNIIQSQSAQIKNLTNQMKNYQTIIENLEKEIHSHYVTKNEHSSELRKFYNELQNEMENKVSKNELDAILHVYPSRDEIIKAFRSKLSVKQFNEQMSKNVTEMNEIFDLHAKDIEMLKREIEDVKKDAAENALHFADLLKQKVNVEDVKQALDLKANIDDVNRSLALKANVEDFNNSDLSTLLQMMKEKVSVQSMRNDYSKCLDAIQRISQEVQSLMRTKVNMDDLPKIVKEIQDPDIIKMMIDEIQEKIYKEYARLDHVREALNKKANVTEVEDLRCMLKSLKEDVIYSADQRVEEMRNEIMKKVDKDKVKSALKTKASHEQVGKLLEDFRKEIKKELILRPTVSEFMKLLDDKPNMQIVNEQIREIKNKIEQFVEKDEWLTETSKQRIINEALLSQNNIARWVWKSGKLKSGHGVPWNVQVINTNPENFIWERDKVNIQVNTPGLYEVTFGFYSKKKPTIQLHVNGEPVISAINSAPYIVHHSSKRISNVDSVTGVTLIDFIVLSEKARVAISYSGEGRAEGFMGLRKL